MRIGGQGSGGRGCYALAKYLIARAARTFTNLLIL
jgi:hypothetical protein